jgi:hypothetical protein
MTSLVPFGMNLLDQHLKTIANAMKGGTGAVLRLQNKYLKGDMEVPLFKAQIEKIQKVYPTGKGVTLKFSKTHLKKIQAKKGGFLASLIPFLANTVLPALTSTVLPALATGALGGVASYGVGKILDAASGKGLNNFGQGITNFGERRGGCMCDSDGRTLTGSGMKGGVNKKKKTLGRGIVRANQLPRIA